MTLRERFTALARLDGGPPSVVSVYLDTRWTDEHKRDRARVFLKTALRKARTAPRLPIASPAGSRGSERRKRPMSARRRSSSRARSRTLRVSPPRPLRTPWERGRLIPLLDDRINYHETSPMLTGGDLDADWQRAASSGEEAVGGSAVTPGQDVVDELGRALGIERESDEEVWTSADILGARDRAYWRLERLAADRDEV